MSTEPAYLYNREIRDDEQTLNTSEKNDEQIRHLNISENDASEKNDEQIRHFNISENDASEKNDEQIRHFNISENDESEKNDEQIRHLNVSQRDDFERDDNYTENKATKEDFQLKEESQSPEMRLQTTHEFDTTPRLSDDDSDKLREIIPEPSSAYTPNTPEEMRVSDTQSFQTLPDTSAVSTSEQATFSKSEEAVNTSANTYETPNKEDFIFKSPPSETTIETTTSNEKLTDNFKFGDAEQSNTTYQENQSFTTTMLASQSAEKAENEKLTDNFKFGDAEQSNTTYQENQSFPTTMLASQSAEKAENEEAVGESLAKKEAKIEEVIEETQQEETQQGETESAENEFLTPGTYLRQVREQNNMSMQQVADRLYLDMGVVKALETDNYERLPPAIFVRGYLRNYARLLEIAPEKIMDAYEQMVQHPNAPSIMPQMKQKKQTSSNDLWFKLVTLVIILTLMALMALWQFFPSSTTQPTPHLANNTNTPIWNTFETNSGEGYLPNTQFNANNDAPTTTTLTGNDNNLSTSATTPEATPSEPPAPKTKTVRVHLRDRAWMKITDETSKKLFEGISRTGQILTLEGLPPFYLQVGNVGGVDVEYEGERHSIRVYPKQRGRNIYIVGGEE